MAKKKAPKKKSARRKPTRKSVKPLSVLPEQKTPRQVKPHSEPWRDIVVAVIGVVLVIALLVLYFLLK